MREGADSFVKNAERLNGLHFPAAERSDCAPGKTTPRLRRGRREEQITTRRRRFPKQKHSTSVGCFCFVHDGNDFPWTAKQRSVEGKSATVRIVLLKRGVRERKDFPDAKGIHRVMGEPRAAHFAAQRRRARCMTRTRARESMSTPVSKRKNSHVCVSFFFCERCVKKAPREGK